MNVALIRWEKKRKNWRMEVRVFLSPLLSLVLMCGFCSFFIGICYWQLLHQHPQTTWQSLSILRPYVRTLWLHTAFPSNLTTLLLSLVLHVPTTTVPSCTPRNQFSYLYLHHEFTPNDIESTPTYPRPILSLNFFLSTPNYLISSIHHIHFFKRKI